VYVAFRMLNSIVLGTGLILVVFVASYFILGYLPRIQDVPVIGQYLGKYMPEFPSTTGEAIAIIRNVFYSMQVLDVSRDANGDLLVTVANTGKMQLSGLEALVDGQKQRLLNNPKDPLKSGEVTVLQLDWSGTYSVIEIKAEQASVTYP